MYKLQLSESSEHITVNLSVEVDPLALIPQCEGYLTDTASLQSSMLNEGWLLDQAHGDLLKLLRQARLTVNCSLELERAKILDFEYSHLSSKFPNAETASNVKPNAPIEGRGGRHSQETSDAQPASPPIAG